MRWTMFVIATALLAAACGGQGPPAAAPEATAPATIDLSDDVLPAPIPEIGAVPLEEPRPLDRGDAFEQLVVITDNTPLSGSAAETQSGPGRHDTALPPPTTAPSADPTDDTVTVRYVDGSERQLLVPPRSLLGVPAVSRAEQVLLHDPEVLLLVADPSGVVGPPGGRYARSEHVLVQYAGDPPATGARADPTDRPATRELAPSDAEIVASIEALPGVVEVVQRGAGVLSVTAEGSFVTGLISAAPGVVSVEHDILLRPGS